MIEIKQIGRANDFLKLLKPVALAGDRPIVGYVKAATMIGWKGHDIGRAVGQVLSRLDAACFYAGLPMLALHFVRPTDGDINDKAFDDHFRQYRTEIYESTQNHNWTDEDFQRIQSALDALPKESAGSIWKNIVDRDMQSGGKFIRYNLHRRIRRTDN